MSHELNVGTNGKYSFASAKEIAWHGLGQIVDHAMTSEEAMKLANLNYQVDKTPCYMEIDGKILPIPKKYATYRTDTNEAFGIVGERYTVVQNTEAFDFFDAIVGKNEAIFETAGCLRQGEIVFITAKLPSHIQVKDDVIDSYLLLTSSHDGTKGISAMFTNVRVVCANTLSAAINNHKYKINITHTKNASEQLKKAHEIMGISNMLSKELEGIYNYMSSKRINDNSLEQYIIQSLSLELDEETGKLSTRASNIVESVKEYYEYGPGQEKIAGTIWGAYNAITGYFQNIRNYKNNEDKMYQTMYGQIHNKNNEAFKLALDIK